MKLIRFRALTVTILSCLIWIIGWFFSPSVLAVTQVKLFDLAYHDCPSEIAEGSVTSGGRAMAANCFLITGKAENKSGKPLVNADVFGRVYDANHDPVM